MRNAQMFSLLTVMIFLLCPAGRISAQSSGAAGASGEISGRVVKESGEPIPFVTVRARPALKVISDQSDWSATTDDQGYFQLTGMPAGKYAVSVFAPGYLQQAIPARTRDGDKAQPAYYQPGDSVTLSMVKGGIITGRVLDANGRPVTLAPVSVVMVRDSESKSVYAPTGTVPGLVTDDRGVYRIYGLASGSYLVFAGGSNRSVPGMFNKHSLDAPTYYPSSNRDNAMEIAVRSGEEISNVDIQYRGERGRSISGRDVAGIPRDAQFGVTINLHQATSGLLLGNTSWYPLYGTGGWRIDGLPDGDYEIVARLIDREQQLALASEPQRINLRGADVTGVQLVLLPLAIIAGQISRDPQPAAPSCTAPDSEEAGQAARINIYPIKVETQPRSAQSAQVSYFPPPVWQEENRAFSFIGLEAGLYTFRPRFADERYYLASITRTATAPVNGQPQNRAGADVTDIARSGIAVKNGDRISDVTLRLSAGAAGLQGRVEAAEGQKIPARLQVILVPAERQAAEDVLRYYETQAAESGAFSFRNLAPGRYRLFARPAAVPGDARQPFAWQNKERAELGQAAEKSGIMVELSLCQALRDFTVPFKADK